MFRKGVAGQQLKALIQHLVPFGRGVQPALQQFGVPPQRFPQVDVVDLVRIAPGLEALTQGQCSSVRCTSRPLAAITASSVIRSGLVV
ncbi:MULTISPECIES: hypothetical protein [Streptomyces]|uniref:hypothetical protein n=1 Tax=Streptomyces TaxID=1883 RepID=UPI001E5740E5|nr:MULTISPECIES: hypothetical protein [Streptomyces]UFQ13656.1 hypothetical protein J2N69_00735 [Streptomyces huasconensis]WCL83251.1 hypothetical protein PPN52_00725 [Streptomyces sp. JCM 35825]